MAEVTASEFQKNFGQYKEIAQREPVSITSNGRQSVVLLSREDYQEYQMLKEESRHAYGGKVSKEFEHDVNEFMDEHADVLSGLSKC